jgi:hypothetical protein
MLVDPVCSGPVAEWRHPSWEPLKQSFNRCVQRVTSGVELAFPSVRHDCNRLNWPPFESLSGRANLPGRI